MARERRQRRPLPGDHWVWAAFLRRESSRNSQMNRSASCRMNPAARIPRPQRPNRRSFSNSFRACSSGPPAIRAPVMTRMPMVRLDLKRGIARRLAPNAFSESPRIPIQSLRDARSTPGNRNRDKKRKGRAGARHEGNRTRWIVEFGSTRGASGGHFFESFVWRESSVDRQKGPGGRRTPPSVLTALD